MPKTENIAVIGAGLSGLTCARILADAGQSIVVFDKGRGLGGRMASRRKDGWRFDHGATVLRPTKDTFSRFINDAQSQSVAAHWQQGDGWAGLPGMSGILKPLSEGLILHTFAEISAIERRSEGWALHGAEAAEGVRFDHLILAVPQPQALRLLSPWPDAQAKMSKVRMQPCWTLMAGFEESLPTEISYASYTEGSVSKISRETTKPDRELPGDGWVVQASADWSTKHLEDDPQQVEAELTKAFFAAIGCTPVLPKISMLHRWRYALTAVPLGQPFMREVPLGLSICGDWCLGASANAAFESGYRLAESLKSDQYQG